MHTNRGVILIWTLCWVASVFQELFAAPQLEGQGLDFGVLKLSVDTDNGFALRKEVNIDTEFVKVHRKSAIGFGDPMVKYSDESDEDSDEGRSKRAVTGNENVIPVRSGRKKRTPCYGQMPSGGGTGTGGDGEAIDEAERRRRARLRRKSTSQSRKKKRQTGRRRRRRDAEIADFADEAKDVGKNFGERMGEVAQKIQNFFGTVLQSTQQLVQRVKVALTGGDGGQEASPNVESLK